MTFGQLFAHNTGAGSAGASVISQAKEALAKAGLNDQEISAIISHDQPIAVGKMKNVAEALNRHGVFGFDKDPNYSINDFLNKERIKAQSIAGIRREHILEAMEEDLAEPSITSVSGRGISPNKPKAKAESRAVFSLNSIKPSKPISSLRALGGGMKKTASAVKSFFKPKY